VRYEREQERRRIKSEAPEICTPDFLHFLSLSTRVSRVVGVLQPARNFSPGADNRVKVVIEICRRKIKRARATFQTLCARSKKLLYCLSGLRKSSLDHRQAISITTHSKVVNNLWLTVEIVFQRGFMRLRIIRVQLNLICSQNDARRNF
jgi:hypothetical protein